jgi:hypothetical protein
MKKLYSLLLILAFTGLSYSQVMIGATNYPTLRAAFDAINAGVYSGDISVVITGNTTETNFATLTGAGYASVTISPSATGDYTILFTGQGYLYLNNASNVTINGMDRLTIAHAQNGSQTIVMTNGASNNTVKNCKVLGSGGSGVIWIFGGLSGNMYNNTVTYCDIGPYNGNLPVYGINIYSSNTIQYNTTVTHNTIHDFNRSAGVSAGINIEGFQGGFTIQNNRIYQSVPIVSSLNNFGIYVVLSQGFIAGNKIISNNEIGSASALGTGTYTLNSGRFTGILYQNLSNTQLVSINDNIIRNISVSGDVTGTYSNSPLLGIVVRSGLAEIKRNTIGSMSQNGSLALSTSSSGNTAVTGIYKDGNTNADVSDNMIGGITASGAGRVDVYGIYMEREINYNPSVVCSGNTIGGTNANSIISTSSGDATVAGIRVYAMIAQIRNNTIRNLTGYGSAQFSSDPTGVIGIKNFIDVGGTNKIISGNTIYNLTNANTSGAGYVAGIYQYANLNSSSIEQNNVYSLVSLSSNSNAIIAGIQTIGLANLENNMVALGNTVTEAARIYGVRNTSYYGNDPNIFNNSVYIGGTATSGNAGSIAYYQDGINAGWLNHDNIYVNNRTNTGATGTHSSIRLDTEFSRLRGNIYYGNGNGYVLGYYFNTPKTTLAAWNSWSSPGIDYGYFTDPHFLGPTAATPDLHISPTILTMVEGHGFGATGTDIDSENRGDLTPNDIGADAGNFLAITQPVITGLSATSVCTTDNAILTITGTDFAGVTQVKVGNTPMTILNASATSITIPAGNMPLSGNIFLINEFATGTSANVFNVYAPPVITQQPVAGNVCTNASVNFSVGATGAVGSYQWLLNGTPLTNTAPFSNVTAATLTVTNPDTTYNGGVLSVIVSTPGNGCSITSNPATLTIFQQPAPAIIQANGNTTICAGSSVTLSTTMPYTTYHWSSGAITPSIVVTATGTYTVTVTNANLCSVTSADITVTVNPNITYYADADLDLYGNPGLASVSCMGAPTGYVANNTDCNDNDNTKHQTYPFYIDGDGDSYGTGNSVNVCNSNATVPPSGYVLNDTDCNDSDITVYRNALLYTDLDGDGYSTTSAVICYGALIPTGYSLTSNGNDCDDSDTSKHQTYPFYTDADGDTFGAADMVFICTASADLPPTGYVHNDTDCDDSDALKHQAFQFYWDNDNDGFGAGSLADVCAVDAATPPMWFSLENTDCDNGNASIHPGAEEILYDGIDNSCDGQLDEGFQIKTKLVPEDCGATFALDATIHIAPLGPEIWAYRIKAVNGATEQTFINFLPEFKMTDFASYAYATTYSISVEVMRNGVWLGYYGDVCQITTPTSANGIYESYAIVSSNGSSDVTYDMQAATSNTDFNGAHLGTYIPGINSLIIKGGQNKIFNYSCPVNNSNLYYRVYKTGTTPGAFDIIPQSFANNIETPGGQLWQGLSGTQNLVTGLENGNYIIEVYASAGFECAPFASFSNNNGDNYKATFSVTSPTPVVVTATSGTPTASYSNLTNAFNAINAQAHKGDILITITGNTFEQTAATLFSNGDYNSIRIIPQGDVTISGNQNSPTFVINIINGHDVIIDGLNTLGNSLTITNPYNFLGTSVPITLILNNCNNITLSNCRLLGNAKYIYSPFNGTSLQSGMIVSAQGNNNVTISNCDFGASSPLYPPLYAINAAGNNFVITNNTIHDYFGEAHSAGVYCPGFSSNWTITNNKFYQTSSRSWQYDAFEHGAIVVAPTATTTVGSAQGFTITGNIIGYASANQTGMYALLGNASSPRARFCGIRFKGLPGAGALPTIISNNTIASVSLTETTSRGTGVTSPMVGISFESGVGTCNNNTIGSQNATGSLIYSSYTFSGGAEIYGILNLSANSWTCNNNTIGGITANNTNNQPVSIYGIKSAGASWSANGNTIGGTTANSIQLTANASQLFGMHSNTTGILTSNVVQNLSANTTVTGIQFDGSNNIASQNFVHGLSGSTVVGAKISGSMTTCTNNMIALGTGIGNAEVNGLYDTGNGNSFYNNSVYIGGSETAGNANSYALLGNGNGSRNYTNNILVNERTNNGGSGTHYGVTIASVSGLGMNRNLYYTTGAGSVFGRLNLQDINNLTSWKTATGQDSGSFFSNPEYINPTAATPDLHINPAVASVVESNGEILPSVLNDFDNDTRSGLTPADIGADAGNFTAPPPGISGLSVLSSCPGTSLIITGSNMGNVTSVTIGGIPATILSITAFSVTVTVGTGNTGVLSVYNATGETGTAADTFTLIPSVSYYEDADGDGYGNLAVMQLSCPIAPAGFVVDNTDCDDTKNTVHPNAAEIGYNLIDDDCDGSIDEGFPPKVTVIQSTMCNTVLAAIDSQLTANLVAGAQGYRWRITTMSGASVGQVQELDTPLRTMKLTQLISYAFATQYKVEVAVRYAGFWQPFTASACTVTTPATTTSLTACGQVLTSMSNVIYANLIPYATGYRFRITDPVTIANTQVIERNVREFRMNLITGFAVQYGKIYNVEVSIRNSDGSWLPYGAACTVTTPVFPTTSLQDSQCDNYQVPTNSTQIYANSYPGAIAYVFQFTGGGLPAPVEVTKSTRTFTLNDFAGQLMPGATYDVRVRLVFNATDMAGPFGKTCTIITPGLARQAGINTATAFVVIAYPNPFADDFNISVTTASSEEIHIKVYDMTGRLLEHKINKAGSNFQSGINYPTGVYNVVVSQGEEAKTLRLIKR